MRISFDSNKREEVLRDDQLDLADAPELLSGVCFEMVDDRRDYGEERWVSIGMLKGKVVVCVWADWGDDHVRVITMWQAEPAERRRYYEYLAELL
jgi:hypothetical protein